MSSNKSRSSSSSCSGASEKRAFLASATASSATEASFFASVFRALGSLNVPSLMLFTVM